MKIKVTTQKPNDLIRQARHLLRQRGYSKAQADALPNGLVGDDIVAFDNLSETQFCALEDAAVRMQLEYDGTQEEKQEEPECPEGYFWNGRQCLKQDNLLRPSVSEREAF